MSRRRCTWLLDVEWLWDQTQNFLEQPEVPIQSLVLEYLLYIWLTGHIVWQWHPNVNSTAISTMPQSFLPVLPLLQHSIVQQHTELDKHLVLRLEIMD